MKHQSLASSILIATLFMLIPAQACGPGFFPDVFIRQLRPDNPKEYAAGKLGILLPTYPRKDLIVAYRYLNGGTLDAKEQAAYEPYLSVAEMMAEESESSEPQPSTSGSTAAQSWTALRSQYGDASPTVEANGKLAHTNNGFTYTTEYTNCNDSAFHTAALTLKTRAKIWGQKSPDLLHWIKGQDAVFANCEKPVGLPSPVPPGSSELLQQDRAYQTAAALFYQGKYAEARTAFATIAKDSPSPWHGIAPYLTARCLIREAFIKANLDEAAKLDKVDPDLLKQAESILEAQSKQPHPGISQQAIEAMLDLIRIRTKPAYQVDVLAKHLAGSAHDPRYARHLTDLSWYLDNQLDAAIREDSYMDGPGTSEARSQAASSAWDKAVDIRGYAPLVDWVITYQSASPEAKEHAFAEWQKYPGPLWLTAALAKATGTESSIRSLLEAAANLKPTDPVWTTAQYHRIRLLLVSGKTSEARKLLDEAVPQIQVAQSDSTLNAYTSLRMHAALDLSELLAYAPRRILERTSESRFSLDECLDVMKNPKRVYDCSADKSPTQFSDDAATFFNTQASLSLLVDAAQSNVLPEPLRRSLILMAWTRSILLHDDAAAQKLYPLLPAKLQKESSPGTGFPALTTIARNAGLRPFLDPGIQRMASYDFVQSYRDNWWCDGTQSNTYQRTNPTQPLRANSVAFLTATQSAEAAKEVVSLSQFSSAKLALGTQILAYAQTHPDDPAGPESLYLVLRVIRYGCDIYAYPETPESKARDEQIAQLRKNAARLLHQRYAGSPWTKKAAPFVG